MNHPYSTKNTIAGILLIIAAVLELLIYVLNFYLYSYLPGTGITFFQFLRPLSAIWILSFAGVGTFLLAKVKPGVAACCFVNGAMLLLFAGQTMSYMYGPIMILHSLLPNLFSCAAFIVAGIMCIAPKSMPKSGAFVALPAILYLVSLAFTLIGFIVEAVTSMSFASTGVTTALGACRMLIVIANPIVCGLGLLNACRWAMADYLPIPTAARAGAMAGRAGTMAGSAAMGVAGASASGAFAAGKAAQVAWFCPSCGKGGNTGNYCMQCGTKIPDRIAAMRAAQQPAMPQAMAGQPGMQPAPATQPNALDTGSFGWAVLGFFVPIVGLILWIVWKDEKPLSAKRSIHGAIASIIVGVVITIIEIIAIVALGASMYALY